MAEQKKGMFFARIIETMIIREISRLKQTYFVWISSLCGVLAS